MKTKSVQRALATVILVIALSFTSNSIFAMGNHPSQTPSNNHQCGGGGNDVNAPLDGGILTILLGGAGTAYLARKKKNKN